MVFITPYVVLHSRGFDDVDWASDQSNWVQSFYWSSGCKLFLPPRRSGGERLAEQARSVRHYALVDS